MGLENPLLYMDVDPVTWLAGAWAVLNMMEALHRERPELAPMALIETTREDVRFIVGPLGPSSEEPHAPAGGNEEALQGRDRRWGETG